jgi:hypothetical protein
LSSSIPQTGIAARVYASNNNVSPAPESTSSIFGDDGFTFGDIIDIVNPLQHIPIVSSIYRKITGDTIAPAMEIAGGALFGGPFGAAISMVTTAFRSHVESDTQSNDPDSPYMNNETNAVANHNTPKAIGNADYISGESTNPDETLQTTINIPKSNQTNWTLSSENITGSKNNQITISSLKSKQAYQPADGIVNLAYKNVENYKDVVTSTSKPDKKVDIIIGSTSGAG